MKVSRPMKPEPEAATAIAVAVVASDAARFAMLRALVLREGHALVESRDADVVLIDGVAAAPAPSPFQGEGWGEGLRPQATAGKPVVLIGSNDRDAAGVLPADASARQIDAALRAAAAGLVVRAASGPRPRVFEELRERVPHVLLTPRELDVLAAISAGLSNKGMARTLGISLHTVKFHVESLFRKLGVRTRAEAVAKGLERRASETVDL
jgi:DNA-binding NarL/FixJ family response regulator